MHMAYAMPWQCRTLTVTESLRPVLGEALSTTEMQQLQIERTGH